MDLKLQVLICTFGQRIAAIDPDGLPKLDGVEYLVSWQNPDRNPEAVPEALARRADIRVLSHSDRGLSKNRNYAFDAATAPFVLIADDDTSFEPDGLRAVIKAYTDDPTLEMATFRSRTPAPRVYPPDGHDLAKEYRLYYAISFEISFRMNAVRKYGIRFSELAGIGAPYLGCGEEDLVMYHSRKAGLKGRFFDTVVAVHPNPTTNEHSATKPEVLRAKGAVLLIYRGHIGAILRFFFYAFSAPVPYFTALKHYFNGYIYAIRNRADL